MNVSREFQDVNSISSGKLSHVPSQPAFVPSLGGVLSRDGSLRSDTWNLLVSRPYPVIDSSSMTYQSTLLLLESMCYKLHKYKSCKRV